MASLTMLWLIGSWQSCQAAGWTSQFVATGPADIYVESSDQVAVDVNGIATSALQYSPSPSDTSRSVLMFARTGSAHASYFRQDPDTQSYGLVSITANQTRTFATVNLTKTGALSSSCWLLELGETGILSETLLTTGAPMACVTAKASADRLFVVTENRHVLVADLNGQILGSVAVGGANYGTRIASIASNGDLLLSERTSSGVTTKRLISTRVSATANLRWQHTIEGVDDSPTAHSETSNSETVLAFANGTNMVMHRIDLSGAITATTQVNTGTHLEDLCLIGSDAYLFDRDTNTIHIRKLPFSGQPVSFASLSFDASAPSLLAACSSQRIYVSLNGFDTGHELAQWRLDGQLQSRTRVSENFKLSYFAQNGDYVALISGKELARFAVGVDLTVYRPNGTKLTQTSVGDLPLQPDGFTLVGSETGGPLLATEAYGAITVHDVQASGRRWAKTVRRDYEVWDPYPSYILSFDMARRADGGADVLSGDRRYQLIRFDTSGTELARYPLEFYGAWDPVRGLHYLDDGSVMTIAEGKLDLFRNGTRTSSSLLALSAAGEDVNHLRFVGYNSNDCPFLNCPDPFAYFANLTPELDWAAGTQPTLPYIITGLHLHRNGFIDHVDYGGGQGFAGASRFTTSGSRVFGPLFPVAGTTGKTLSAAVHPDLGQLISLESAATPNSASILLRIDAMGHVLWTISLPFRAKSVALDDSGRAGASGKSTAGNHLRVFEADGTPWLSEDCADRHTCAYGPELIAAAGTRWFAAGTAASSPASVVRDTYVREYDTSLFSNSFE